MSWKHICITGFVCLLTMGNHCFAVQFDPGRAWDPSPENLAVDVRYHTAHPAAGGVTLSWKAGDWIGSGLPNAHYVYLGTVLADVNSAGVGTAGTASPLFRGVVNQPEDDVNGDPNIFIAETGILVPNMTYYWRVDEVNETEAGSPWKGIVWSFTTIRDKTRDPIPAGGAANLTMPLELKWTAGDWSPNVHRVYFGTNLAGVTTNTTDGRYRGTVSSPVYPLSDLLNSHGAIQAFGYLQPNTSYSWRVDCDSYLGTNSIGYTWLFNTGNMISIDDFQRYERTTDLNSVWIEGPLSCSSGTKGGSGKIALVREGQSGRYMQFSYDKTGGTGLGGQWFSEIEMPYDNADWMPDVPAEPPNILELNYRGLATNSNDPDNDRMYVAVEDTDGDISVTLNPDPDAQLVGTWTTWAISYSQLVANGAPGDVDMNHITGLYIGMGYRCADDFYGGGEGNVMFDDIKLKTSYCMWPPVADFDGNCIVNLDDLKIMSEEWLTEGVKADIYEDLDNIVNFRDFAILGDEWLTVTLWP